jgi:hypothetical protein
VVAAVRPAAPAAVRTTIIPPAKSYELEAQAGSYNIVGTDATFRFIRSLDALAGSYSISGSPSNFMRHRAAIAAAGSYSIIGRDAALKMSSDTILLGEGGSYSISGTDATLTIANTGASAYPTILTTSQGQTAGDATADADLPASIATDNLLLGFIAHGGVLTTPSGWTQLYTAVSTVVARHTVIYKVASGSEGSTISLTSANAQAKQYAFYRISNYRGVPSGTSANAGSGNIDPPNHTVSWGSDKNLWFAVGRGSLTAGLPTNYSDGLGYSNTIRVSTRELEAASENPSEYPTSFSTYWTAGTVAVRGL